MANEGGGGEPMPHVRGLDGARLAQAAAAMTQAGGVNLTQGSGSSSAEGSPSPDPGEGAAGVVLVDELDSDEVAQALAGGIPELGGEVRVVEGYKDPLRQEDEVG